MKKVICYSVLSLSLLMVSACNQTTPSSIDFDPYTENAFLDFVEKNTVYFDVHIDYSILTSLNLSIGNQRATGSGKLSFNKDDDLTSNEYPSGLYYAFILEDATSNVFYTNYNTDQEGKSVEFVNHFKSIKNYDRCYLYMTNKIDGWNHSLSQKLNIYLNEKFFPGSGD